MTDKISYPENVIAFRPRPTFSCLNAGSDGFFVLFGYGESCPVEAIGPFRTVHDASIWAVATGAREKVAVNWRSFAPWPDDGGAT